MANDVPRSAGLRLDAGDRSSSESLLHGRRGPRWLRCLAPGDRIGGSFLGPRSRSGCLDPQDEITNVDLVPLAHDRGLGDLPPVDVCAVRALEVGHDEPTVTIEEPSVPL